MAAAGHDLDEAGWELATELHAETEGNPFFVGEIMRHLAETGVIYQRDGRWVSDRTVGELGIPEGVREVVGRRLDRLSDSANEALAVAAVIGRDFDLETLASAGGLDEDAVIRGLDESETARLVQETAVGRFRFAHALVRDTLYGELSATRRARLHGRIAAQLAIGRPDDVAALAHHYA